MEKDELLRVGKKVIDCLQNQSFRPKELLEDISSELSDEELYTQFVDYWNSVQNWGEIDTPLQISRGWDEIIPQDQLLHYLPEEKLLINKDIFRNKLDGVDLTSISGSSEKSLMEELLRDSIGLSKNDVLLYYNLLKINQISVKSKKAGSKEDIIKEHSKYIFNLLQDGFNLHNISEDDAIKVITKNLESGKSNSQIISLAAGRENDKFFNFLKEFLIKFISRRGDDEGEILRYIGLYILFNGAKDEDLSPLNLTANEIAFITDRIGRVRSIYYTLVLFIHTFNLLICAQVYEISTKFLEADGSQKEKLKKLYWDDTRRKLLYTNALGIATRKISSNKSDASEILGAFKRFTSKLKVFVTKEDLFEIDYRG